MATIRLRVDITPQGPVLIDEYTGNQVENCTDLVIRYQASHQLMYEINATFFWHANTKKENDNSQDYMHKW